MVSVYSAAHFLIDFACAFLMFRFVAGTSEGFLCVLIYNFCAFAMQMPIGIIADKINRNSQVAIMGCALAALSFGFTNIPIIATVIIGIGNAMFHIGGGIDVLNISEKKLSALGVFVSPGAFGIYYGTILGRGSGFSAFLIPLVLILAAAVIFAVHKTQKNQYPKNVEFSLKNINSNHITAAIACFFFVVCLRSFVGLTLNFPWRGSGYWGIALLCAVVFGKTIGGFIADRFGTFKTALFSLSLTSILFLFPAIPLAGVTAVLLFNMTMPITLWAMAKLLPAAKGFAFGILTFGLFIGFLPVYLGVDVSGTADRLFALLAVVSLAVLLFGLRRAKL
jgi:FSR family fosmidomycin resistance protein-like MFS transporter